MYEALDRLLFREWDPAGVYPNDNLQDEYHPYLPGFWRLAEAGATVEEIAEYLREIEVTRMGGDWTGDECRNDVAKKALAVVAASSLPVRSDR